jgi:hypothetical protein
VISRGLGFLAITACVTTILFMVCYNFSMYILSFVPSEGGFDWDWLETDGKCILIFALLISVTFWKFRVPRAMFGVWLLRALASSMIALSVFCIAFVGYAGFVGSDFSPDFWLFAVKFLVAAAALLSMGGWTLVLTRPGRRRQTNDVDDRLSGS